MEEEVVLEERAVEPQSYRSHHKTCVCGNGAKINIESARCNTFTFINNDSVPVSYPRQDLSHPLQEIIVPKVRP